MPNFLSSYSSRLPLISGILVLLLGALALLGCCAAPPWRTLLSGVPFDTAAAFLLSGAALIAASRQARAWSTALVFAVGAVATANLAESLLDFDTYRVGIQALAAECSSLDRQAPNSALAFLLSAAGLAFLPGSAQSSVRRYFASLLGTGPIAIGIVDLLYVLVGVDGSLPTMTLWPALGHILLGSGLVALAHGRAADGKVAALRRTGLIVVVSLLAVTLFFWNGLQRFGDEQLDRRIQAETASLARTFETGLRHRVDVINSMAKRWEAAGGVTNSSWRQDAETHLEYLSGFLSIQWIDATGRVRWVVPEAGNEAVIGLDNTLDATRNRLFERARESGGALFSEQIELRQGGQGLLLVRALRVSGQLDGYLVAAFRTADLIFSLSEDLTARSYRFAISLEDRRLFASADWQENQPFRTHFPMQGGTWQLELAPKPSAIEHSPLPAMLLCGGIALSILAGIAFWLWAWSEQRAVLFQEANHALRLERNFVTGLVDHTNAICLVLDRKGRIVRFNQAGQALSGYSFEEVRGTAFWTYQLDDNGASSEQAFFHWLANPRPTRTEKIMVTKNGEHRVIAWSSSVMNDPQGRPEFVCSMGIDITARRQVEQALIAAKDEAESANRAKSQFLSSMSHELRTPMNAMLGFAQLMDMDDTLPDEHQESVGQILSAGSHLLKLINDILSLAKIEAGNIGLSIEAFDCVALIGECVSMVSPLSDKQGIQIEVPPPAPVVIQADRRFLKQVVLNLLSNAIKYNRPSGSVRIDATADARGMVQISVADTGYGIPPDRLPELFQPFNRLGAENKNIEGSGIGLSVCKQLVEAMNGEITVSSDSGAGCVFQMTLPGAARASATTTMPEPEVEA